MSRKKIKQRACVRSCTATPRDRVMLLALMLGPALAAFGWDVLGSGGPQAASAAAPKPLVDPALIAGLKVRMPTEAEAAAAAYCASLCAETTPIDAPTRLPMIEGAAESEPETEEAALGIAPPTVRIASFLRNRDGSVSIFVDGELLEAGDSLGDDGWTISAIDPQARSVTIEHPDATSPVVLGQDG